MIVAADENFVSGVKSLFCGDPFACRIISQYSSYDSSLAFVDYWTIVDDASGVCTGAVSRCGTQFILLLTDKTDLDEVSAFMRVAGVSGAICSAKYRLNLGSSKYVSGVILKRTFPFEVINGGTICDVIDVKRAYELIAECADENFVPPSFEDFYVDVNHKLRHGSTRLCGILDGSRLAAMAMTVAECDFAAVLGAVACRPDCRNRGLGSIVVKYLTNLLVRENKTVYLHRAKNANLSFYDNLGFEKAGEWCEYYFER